ncbi:hypothetical protein FO519_001995 [Halicephalobus sp. NKZ332]|nr:hypothetical protein FO519_001995 [Halicephalobus sp. NKZ332]
MSSKIVILCALIALVAFSATPAEAQFYVSPYSYYPFSYYPYGYVWGSNKGGDKPTPDAPMPPPQGPSFTNNAPKF